MPSFDYTPIIATAQGLITDFGRSITFVGFNSTPSDVAQPWLGATDPRATPDATLVVDAVFVSTAPGELGASFVTVDLVKDSEQIIMVSPGAAADLTIYQEIIDGSTTWKIVDSEILQPGADVVIAFVGVKR